VSTLATRVATRYFQAKEPLLKDEGSFFLKFLPQHTKAVEPIIKLLAQKKLKIDHFITHDKSIEDVQKVFDLVANYSDNVVKALVRIT